ncbi:MAG: VanW family protein [Acidimicrobiia bacterium]|nr:MAG: VanW family protein [Acidimicrobiia bacterium]
MNVRFFRPLLYSQWSQPTGFMPRAVRLTLFAVIPIVLLMLVPIAVYGIDRAATADNVARNVSVAGVAIGSAPPEEARARIEAYEKQRQTSTATFVVEGAVFELDPEEIGLEADVDGALETALAQRKFGFVAGFIPWVQSFGSPIELDLTWSVDTDALDRVLVDWEGLAIENPAYEGAVAVVDGEVTFQYPTVGVTIDRAAARRVMLTKLALPDRSASELALAESIPTLTEADIDETVATINAMLSQPAVLNDFSRGASFELSRAQLANAIRVDITHNSPATIEVSLSQDVVAGYLAAQREELDIPAVNVSFDVDMETDTVSIIPSLTGRTVDPEAATAALLQVATTSFSRSLPYMDGAEPEYSTEDAEALGPLGLVSEFTTNTPGVNRVFNIHLMADTIDGQVVWPGEEFSINDFIGERTEEKGYLRDGAIIGGEVTCCESRVNIGGGVSQYATTMYNAIFFGCYKDIDHTPHSLAISRYPEGREATLGFPAPDLRFGNDTEAPVIIRNSYDGNRTITVKFYGNNGGRVCTAERSARFSPTGPRTVYEPNPAIDPGTEHIVSKGSGGFSVTVTRVMTMPDGTVIREPYTHRYRGAIRKIEKHPCDLSSIACPVQVPGVAGLDFGSAKAMLGAAGFLWSVSYVPDADNVGKVISASPDGWQPAGTTISLTVGEKP